jgi:hypothetical protein
MLRITPSLLDSFRLFHEADFMSLQDLESRIKREPITPTPAMLLGAAFHKIAERSPDVESTSEFYSIDGLLFDRESVDDALEPLKDGISEVWCSRVLDRVPHAPLLRGRVDRIVGATPWEIKTKDKDFDPEYYAASLQWTSYLHMLDVDECRYLLVRLEEGEDCWRVKYADPLPLFRYCGMDDHLNEWAGRFMAFCETRNLLSYLTLKEA